MASDDKVNILLVDDQPAKLLSYETILAGLNERLIKAASAKEALEHLLKQEIAVILVDVCMPELDGFQLAAMIREHPRFQRTAIIFISAIHLTDVDRLRAYEMGAVDYVPVPVIPEVLRAKVKVFAELYRKTRQLEQLNQELERRVAERTAELEASTVRLLKSEERRSLALAAGQMGSWEWDPVDGRFVWDDGQYRIFGVDPASFDLTVDNVRALIHPEDWKHLQNAIKPAAPNTPSFQSEFRVCRPNGELRWCIGTAVASVDGIDNVVRISGVTVDITDRKQAEERQVLLAREVDHRARNALALVQSIVRLTRSEDIKSYTAAVDGRIGALARAHTLLAQSRWQGADLARLVGEELAPFRTDGAERIATAGPEVSLEPRTAQTLALALHELSTNAAKYGALSVTSGRVAVSWDLQPQGLVLRWIESGGAPPQMPVAHGFGIRLISASIERQLGGEAAFDWRPEGLHCLLRVPRRDYVDTLANRAAAQWRLGEDRPELPLRLEGGNRVLLVEDEILVAMMMKDILTELGFSVIGPFSRLSEAMVAAVHEDINAGIIDVNLGGEFVYPVADVLAARKIPFVFITGYGVESIDSRFEYVPIVKKPVQRQVLQKIFVPADAAEPAKLPKRRYAAERVPRAASVGQS
ncbi:MAG: response regulator [Alphaproteobacteria bacterium]|nr:MAG: response regulator [Alphaproteobacteria bacterium]TMJ97005.1 MAG: response regulator [Alphaproteobacteria bacterium]